MVLLSVILLAVIDFSVALPPKAKRFIARLDGLLSEFKPLKDLKNSELPVNGVITIKNLVSRIATVSTF